MLLDCLGSLGIVLGLLYLLAYACFFSFSLSCSFIDIALMFHVNGTMYILYTKSNSITKKSPIFKSCLNTMHV